MSNAVRMRFVGQCHVTDIESSYIHLHGPTVVVIIASIGWSKSATSIGGSCGNWDLMASRQALIAPRLLSTILYHNEQVSSRPTGQLSLRLLGECCHPRKEQPRVREGKRSNLWLFLRRVSFMRDFGTTGYQLGPF